MTFKTGGVTEHSIGKTGSVFYIKREITGDTAWGVQIRLNTFCPSVSGGKDCGTSGLKWRNVYATNGSIISTSDENAKQQIAPLTTAEVAAGTALSKLFCTYKWNDRVATAGDAARMHTGVIAQQVGAAMTAAGLDPTHYGFYCVDTYYMLDDKKVFITGKDAEPAPDTTTPTYDEYSLRMTQLLSFIAAATEHRLTSLESRLTALEP
jgi:hypothetical protein